MFCLNGGCDAKCDTLLSCGIHRCVSKCHMIQDHSKMPCKENISSTCDVGHKQTWKCDDRHPQNCRKCEHDAQLAKEKQEQEIDARETEQRAHLVRMDAINAEIAKELQAQEDVHLKKERSQAIQRKEDDLVALISSRTMPMVPAPSVPAVQASTLSTTDGRDVQTSDGCDVQTSDGRDVQTLDGRDMETSDECDVQTSPDNVPSISPLPPAKVEMASQMSLSSVIIPKPFPRMAESPSKKEWLRHKNMEEGASNPPIDAIMDMTGLEEVKKKVLNIKSKIDLSTGQNISVKQERVNAVLLWVPATLVPPTVTSVTTIPEFRFSPSVDTAVVTRLSKWALPEVWKRNR